MGSCGRHEGQAGHDGNFNEYLFSGPPYVDLICMRRLWETLGSLMSRDILV